MCRSSSNQLLLVLSWCVSEITHTSIERLVFRMSANSTTTQVTLIGGNCDPTVKRWWVFFCSSIITFAGGLFLVFLGRLITYTHKKISKGRSSSCKRVDDDRRRLEKIKTGEKQGDIGCVTAAKDWAGELISGQTNSGRILVCHQLVCDSGNRIQPAAI